MAHVLSKPVSDDEDGYILIDRERSQQANATKKRLRADSSPIAASRVIVNRRKTPFDPSSSPIPSRYASSPPPESLVDLQSDGETAPLEDLASDIGSSVTETVKRRDKTKAKRLKMDPDMELLRCIDRIKASKSDAYTHYEYPTLDDSVRPPTHYHFKCKTCDQHIPRCIGVSETSGLHNHTARCPGRARQTTLLTDCGVTGSSSKLGAEEVREYCALWVAENARPYQIVNDRYLRKLLGSDTRKHMPHRDTLSQDIKQMYEATQKDLKAKLAEVKGVFHIALDMLSSDNGLNLMGLVVFHPIITNGTTITINQFVLECLSFGGDSHTGANLARSVYNVLCKFGIENRVWGAACDNAENNKKMMQVMASYGLTRLTGPNCRVMCMAHILNLVAQSIASGFRKHKPTEADKEDDDDEFDFCIDFDEQMADPADVDEADTGEAPSWTLHDDEELLSEIDLPEIEPGSPEALELTQAGKVLWKSAHFAHKVRFSVRTRNRFKKECEERDLGRPHNVQRDQQTRWNSTEHMTQDTDRTFPAILATQAGPSLGIPRSHRLRKEDQKYIKGLNALFKPLSIVSDIFSRAGVPLLADVIVHFDSLDYMYANIANNPKEPLYVRTGAERARVVLNKYYQMTDDTHLYCMGMILHPSLRKHYMKKADWEPEWIVNSTELTQQMYRTYYKTPVGLLTDAPAPESSQFDYSPYMSHLFLNETEKRASKCPVLEFADGAPIFDHGANGQPILCNLLQWWYNQRLAGNEWDGLTQMAIDVLSMPATSVDVERAFSYVGSIISKRRHNLKPYSIQATATLGSYSKANLVKRGCLELPRKMKGKDKGKGKGTEVEKVASKEKPKSHSKDHSK